MKSLGVGLGEGFLLRCVGVASGFEATRDRKLAKVVSVTAAVQGVVWVLVLTVVTLYAMGILTTRLRLGWKARHGF